MSEQHEETTASSPPRKTIGWGVILAVSAAFVVALALGVAFAGRLKTAYHAVGLGDHDLVEKVAADGTHYWTCGMHPWVVLPEPGECPICHMDLVPLDPAKFASGMTIDPIVVQNIGVRTAAVTTGPLVQSIRTVGNVTYDETRVVDVNTRFSGWIEKLDVDSLGERVTAGEPLFEIYSPALYAAQQEYQLALRNDSAAPGAAAETNRQLLASAKTRLELFDLGDDQIAALGARDEPQKTVAVRSPAAGVVVEKMATQGMQVTPGMRVYRIADLSTVWVQATVYESQLPFVKEGQAATMTLAYLPGASFAGRVAYVYPTVNEKTREATVRLEFDNADGRLKPGMFADVTLQGTLAESATLAPQSAVMRTGKRQVAIVSLGGGKFEPRDVTSGAETDGSLVQILSGLKPGEQVVTSGQFLLDSEARMREALAKMIGGNAAADQEPTVATADAETVVLPADAARPLDDVLTAYLQIADALAKDSTDGVAAAADELAAAASRLKPAAPSLDAEAVMTSAGNLKTAGDLKAARDAFAKVSDAVVPLARKTGVPTTFAGGAVEAMHCPMYAGGTRWLQPAGEVRNPYMGSKMIGCFDERDALPTTPVEESK